MALEALENAYRLDPDYRVKCNVISAMANFDYDEVRDLAFEALRDSNLLVAERAATFFLENGIARDGFLYYSIAREGLPWQVNTPLYAAVLRHLPSQYKDVRNSATSRLRQKLRDDETSPFEKVAALRALAEDPWNFRFIYEQGFPSDIDMVRQGAVEALGLISSDPGASSETFTRYLAPHFREAIESGDPALMLPAAEALGQGDRNYRDVYGDLDFLESAYAEVSSRQPIPELERSLAIALDSLVGGDRSARLGPPLRAIDWKLLEQAGPNPEITLQTEEGAIVLRLFSQEAPGTVSSFLQLIEDGYYEESYFYRVVPNFVAQGAQPLGFRSPSFVLSSELSPRHYLEGGRLGMASAGPHTESIHFFITHSPTPHLDGRYTLFGEVVEGMEVVHRLRRGSRIERTIYTPEALN